MTPGHLHTHPRIGVLAVQGAFAEHIQMLERCGAEAFGIREPKDLKQEMQGVILPGGERTVQVKLLHELGLFSELRQMIRKGLPAYGTCAGSSVRRSWAHRGGAPGAPAGNRLSSGTDGG